MGEARRKKEAVLNGLCPCSSQKVARGCCWNGQHWHKSPAILGLHDLPPAARVEKCYMNDLGSCVAPISGEHLISDAVIRILQGDGDFSVAGLPWLEDGEVRILASENLKTKCLCRKHNSALHPLDDSAKYFFASVMSALQKEKGSSHALLSGHDIERWLLKTAKAFAVSGNFARGREQLPGGFADDLAVLGMLDDPSVWPAATGLYCVMMQGDLAENHRRFQMQPLTN